MKQKLSKRKIFIKIFFLVISLIVIGLLFYLFRNILFEIIRLTRAGDDEGVKAFMADEGWLGLITVMAVEALEMVVVFIPAELIQIPAGLSFPIWLAIILCDVGVCIGASLIYFIVNTLKIKPEYIESNQKKIKTLATKKKGKNTQVLMYFLFITPVIPFGAICYFASTRKISYRRYLLTVATGVLPSIVTSILLGKSIKYFISNNLPLWALILIILGLMAILLIGMSLIRRKVLFDGKKVKGTPNSSLSEFAQLLFAFYSFRSAKCRYIEDALYDQMGSIEGPVIYLCNHQSPYDCYFAYRFVSPVHPALIYNRYYNRPKFVRFIVNGLGFIPKCLFMPDLETVKKTMRYAKNDTSLLMFPEARLSLDGSTYPVTKGTAELLKKINLPVVLLKLEGNYIAHSKVRRSKTRCRVQISVNKIIDTEELQALPNDELEQIINKTLAHNEFEYSKEHTYRHHNKAHNLDAVLYHCPKCGNDYTMHAKGNTLYCDCGFSLELDKHYQFNDNPYGIKNIHDYYEYIKSVERENIASSSDIIFTQEVKVRKMSMMGKRYDEFGEGVISLTREGLAFSGKVGSEEINFKHSLKVLQALAFSIREEYECYYNNELYYFYPKVNPESCTRVALLYDLLEEENNQ